MVALFIFIHRPEDYLKYACISVMSGSIMCIANWIYCRRYVRIRLLFSGDIFRHLKPMFIFFANSLAITIYVSADTTMLGWISGDYYTGLYAVSVKIYQIVKRLMTAVYTVTIPRLSRYAGRGEWQNYRSLLTQICGCVILLVVPCMTGLAVYAGNIIQILSGDSYLPAVRSLQILAVALLFAVGSGVVVNCINTPNGFEKTSLSATIAAAVVNVGLNIILIPIFRQDGAALTTVLAEAMVLIICLVRLRDINHYMDVREVLSQLGYAAAGSVLILGISFAIGKLGLSSLLTLVLGIFLCAAAYALLLAAGRNRYFMAVLSKVLRRR
jgi:O-antigen/teichoic acid export membrane protein